MDLLLPSFWLLAESGRAGIRQGCPLSPLLFILVIEGLSILIEDAKRNGKIKGIKILSQLFLTHLLFVDDVILFGLGTFEEWIAFKVTTRYIL